MGLSCYCDDYPEPGMVMWTGPEDYTTLNTKRAKQCCSCKERIEVGALCGVVSRFKVPDHDVEISIYGEDGEIPRAPKYLCERCTDLFLSLDELGFCQQPWEDQRELVKEYAAMQNEAKGHDTTYGPNDV